MELLIYLFILDESWNYIFIIPYQELFIYYTRVQSIKRPALCFLPFLTYFFDPLITKLWLLFYFIFLILLARQVFLCALVLVKVTI